MLEDASNSFLAPRVNMAGGKACTTSKASIKKELKKEGYISTPKAVNTVHKAVSPEVEKVAKDMIKAVASEAVPKKKTELSSKKAAVKAREYRARVNSIRSAKRKALIDGK